MSDYKTLKKGRMEYLANIKAFRGLSGGGGGSTPSDALIGVKRMKDFVTEVLEEEQTKLPNYYTDEMWSLNGFNLLPVGNQKPLTCDCGGFVTYKSMSPEHHSDWCKTRNAK